MKRFSVFALLLLLCLLLGCAPKEHETAATGEGFAHFHYGGSVFYLDNTTPTVSVIPSHFLPVGELILSNAKDDRCGNVEGLLLMSESHPDFAYVELPGSEEDARVYAIFSAENSNRLQDEPAFSVTFSGGLEILLEEENDADQIFDIVILPEYSRTWTAEKEAERLAALGYELQPEGSLLRGRLTAQQLLAFPAMTHVCLYEILPAIVYDGSGCTDLISLRDEAGCRTFLEEQNISIPEGYEADLEIRGFILSAEMDPHTVACISHPPVFDFSEAVRTAVLEYHGLSAKDS